MDCGGFSMQAAVGPRLFDFGSDDLLCSFEEYALRSGPTDNGKLLDSSAKNLYGNRVRSPTANLYGQPKEFSREDVIYAVEKCMKKYADNLTMHLEGISGRLTQVELCCYKLERSIGEFRTDMIRDRSEADLKLNSLEKNVHEVRRSVQIIRDKQELSETQKNLTKLLLSQKASTDLTHSQKKVESLNSVISENKSNYESHDIPNHPLALTLPYQISSPPPSISITVPDKNHPDKEPPVQQSLPSRDHYTLNQPNAYYYTHHQPLLAEQQSQNLQPELHYAQQRVKMHELSLQAQSPTLETPPAYAPNQQANTIPEPNQSSNILSYAPLAKTGYVGTNTFPSQSNMLGYEAVYVIDGNRTSYPQSYHLGNYPPNGNATALLTSCGYPCGNMGYPRDQMVGVVFGTAESG